MMSTIAPRLLRILCTLPEPVATSFRWSFQRLRPQVDMTCIPVSDINSYLAEAGYYHVLYVSAADWRAVTPDDRRRFASRVNLVVLAPDVATSADLADVRAVVYLPAPLVLDEVVAFCADMHARLAQGWRLNACVATTEGCLTFVGDEACWPDSGFVPRKEPTTILPAASKPVVAAGISAERISVAGDVVHGDKSVIHGEGDQVITATISGAAKIVQQAGGDQVNVNRVSSARVEIVQTAGEDQANVNRISDASPQITQAAGGDQANVNTVTRTPVSKACPACGSEVSPSDRFCSKCGAEI